jgi:hypothetical protein
MRTCHGEGSKYKAVGRERSIGYEKRRPGTPVGEKKQSMIKGKNKHA